MLKKILLFSLVVFLSKASLFAQTKTITGFNKNTLAKQVELENEFDKLISPASIGASIKEMSAFPHALGSPRGKQVADYILARFKEWGLEAKIETYTVLFPTPKTRVLEMTGPTTYKALLKEPVLKEDATSGQADQLPTYNAWSADGDVTAELVFVNYGLPEDYEKLEAMNIDVKGKIVIAKYGRSWRGIKPKVAQEHGAVGCIIYSDPKDDGYMRGDVYPKGAYKSEYGVQRGSIMDMVIYPGDPLTPGKGATESASRLKREDAPNLLKIPVLPISYHDAQPLLSALQGPVVPADWAGGLPFTYHIGPGKTTVHLATAFDWKMVPAYNVIGTLKGSDFPDEWVIRGNHHDAWVNGANDPVSGMAALMEEAKALGTLNKQGWKPKRTMLFCAWDGEEPGLIGSTEWVEDHEKELQQKAVVYINSDANGRGFLDADGSHALENMMYEVAGSVTDPQTGVSVYERQKAYKAVTATSLQLKKDALNKNELKLGALGSGSDYSSFLQHIGIPSLNLGFGGEDPGGEYHSIYDSYDDYQRFKDPGFVYGAALSKVAGHAAIRMANADVLPFDYRSLKKTIDGYVTSLTSLLDEMRETTEVENRLVKEKIYSLSNDPTLHLKAPVAKAEVPYLDFSPLQNALYALNKSAEELQVKWTAQTTASQSDAFNKKLFQAEQHLLTENGLPRRGWYKHTLYAPGFYTGYGVKTLPGIREAIEQRDFKEAQEQIKVDADAIVKLANYLSGVAK